MIFADKLIELRKRNGMSQEDLANQLNVTRQAISKWESAQSMPDSSNIAQMSKLFGVSEDTLLNDDKGLDGNDDFTISKVLSKNEASLFIKHSQKSARVYSMAVMLFIMALGIYLAGRSYLLCNYWGTTASVLVGTILSVGLVAIGVPIWLAWSFKNPNCIYNGKTLSVAPENIEYVKSKREDFGYIRKTYNAIGIVMCILCAIPLIVVKELEPLSFEFALGMVLIVIGVAVKCLVYASVANRSFQRLFGDGWYAPRGKKISSAMAKTTAIFWSAVLVTYLAHRLLSDHWYKSWTIIVICSAGYLLAFCIVNAIVGFLYDRRNK